MQKLVKRKREALIESDGQNKENEEKGKKYMKRRRRRRRGTGEIGKKS